MAAGKIELNLKQFKHVKSDKDSTVLQHEAGHQLTLAHNALSPQARQQLMQLAQSAQTPSDKAEAKTKMADGGKVQKFEDGGDVDPTAIPVNNQGSTIDTSLPAMTEMAGIPKTPQEKQFDTNRSYQRKINEGNMVAKATGDIGWPEMVPDQAGREKNALIDTINEQDNKKAIEDKKANDEAVMDKLRAQVGMPPLIPQEPITGTTPDGQPAVQSQPPASSNPMDATEGMLASGFQNQMAGVDAQAKAQGDLGTAREAILKTQAEKQQQAQTAYDNNFQELEQERQAHMQDIRDGHIDPDKYWTGDKNGNGGHSKIASAIGMILAGFNPTSNPNAAVGMLKFQMEQNLDAQKQNLNSNQNLLAANLRQFGNLRDATDMTRIMQHDIIASQLDQAAAHATSPMAKAAALQAKGKLQMEYAPLQQQFAMRRAMMQLANSPANPDGSTSNTAAAEKMLPMLRMMAPEQAKEMETRLVPKVGMANRPVAEGDRQKMLAHQKFGAAVQDMQNFVKTHSTVLPGTADYNVGQQKAMALQALARESMLNTVYREGEQPLLDKLINSNPAGIMKNIKTTPQLNELNNMNNRDFNIVKQSYGLPTQQQAQAPQIKVVNGIKYMRGPDGKAIPVK